MKAKFLLLMALLAFVSVVVAQPTGLISNIFQAQTQVSPAQTVFIGGGSSPPKACMATSPFTENVSVKNPNTYNVTGVLWMNITMPGLYGQSSVSITGAGLDVYVFTDTNPRPYVVMVRIRPLATPNVFSLPPGVSYLPAFTIILDVSGNYTWTMWMAQS